MTPLYTRWQIASFSAEGKQLRIRELYLILGFDTVRLFCAENLSNDNCCTLQMYS